MTLLGRAQPPTYFGLPFLHSNPRRRPHASRHCRQHWIREDNLDDAVGQTLPLHASLRASGRQPLLERLLQGHDPVVVQSAGVFLEVSICTVDRDEEEGHVYVLRLEKGKYYIFAVGKCLKIFISPSNLLFAYLESSASFIPRADT